MPKLGWVMHEEAIRLNGVSHHFGQQVLFEGLTVAFRENTITALLGKSGSGKSTLLQLINGLIKPDRGVIYLSDKPLNYQQIHTTRRTIGYAVQQVGLFPHLSAFENMVLPGVISGWQRDKMKSRAEYLMQLVGLSLRHKDKYPYQLSGGEQQRVGLCRAIFLNPPFMLLDEPFSSLDPATKALIHEEVLRLQRHEPRCIILVTHDPEEAKKLGDVAFQFKNKNLFPVCA